MKKNLIFILFLLSFLMISKYSYAKINNKIVIKVENEIITSYEIKNKILTLLNFSGTEVNQKNINQLKKQAVESLIQHKLKKIELKKYNIKKNTSRINSYLKSISSNNVSGLKMKFEENNLDYELFMDEVEVQSMWQELVFKLYSKKFSIDETLIEQELKNSKNTKKDLREFKISEIEIMLENNKNDDKKIQNIISEIQKDNFESVALKYSISSSASNNGDLGWISEKSMSNQIHNIIKDMKIGQVSKPIRRQNTVLFLKVQDIRNSKITDLNLVELKKKLINQKKNELVNLYSLSHLSKVRNTSLIEYK
tara:strand:+ start:1415 stop:2344 length:930 start_codon:yes stop_codon:yes gene_type:complete